jgi:hypothetical protein
MLLTQVCRLIRIPIRGQNTGSSGDPNQAPRLTEMVPTRSLVSHFQQFAVNMRAVVKLTAKVHTRHHSIFQECGNFL